MKITGIKTYILEKPLGKQQVASSQGWKQSRQAMVVVVSTDEGISGVGESIGSPSVLERVINDYTAPLIIGRDPFDTNAIWADVYGKSTLKPQWGVFVQAFSGIDIALWDIKGKALGVPVYKLLGGALRNRAHAYATGLYRPKVEDPMSALVREAVGYKQQGFFAMKLKIGYVTPDEDIAIIGAIREAIGDEVKLMVDANCAYDAAEAIQMARRMEPYNIQWFEEPVHPLDIEGYLEVKRNSAIPIAGGECLGTCHDFLSLVTNKAVDILQPDVCIVGGFTEIQRIVALSNAHHLQCFPHVWGTNVAIAAALQLYAALPNVTWKVNPPEPFFEFDRSPNPLREMTTIEQFELKDSYIDIPQGPGLGITPNIDYMEENAVK